MKQVVISGSSAYLLGALFLGSLWVFAPEGASSQTVLDPRKLEDYGVKLLKARIEVAVQPGAWTYTIINNEPPGSPHFIAAFSLDIAAPVTVTGTPEGWESETDNASYVLWTAADHRQPYAHHITPGQSLGGFQIQSARHQSESTPYVVTAWDHQSDEAGLVYFDRVLSPSRTPKVPEK